MQHLQLVACLFFLSLGFSLSVVAQPSESRVVVHQLKETALTTELELSGTLHPLREADLSVAADALVTKLHADVGKRVKRGDLLLELDASVAQQEHARALALVSSAELSVKEAQRLLDQALRLKDQSHIAQTEVSARENELGLAKASLAQARAESSIAAEQLAKHRLYAPFDGVISARWTDLGQWLSRGDQVFTLVSLDLLRLDVKLPQEHLASIEHIKTVQIHPDTQPQLAIPAHIDTLVPVGDASRSFLLRLAADTTSSALVPGASARAMLRFEHTQQAVLLPRDALLRNADGNYCVFVVADGKAQRRQIRVGALGRVGEADGYLIEEGLAAGEQVVIRGNEILEDGQAVAVVKAQHAVEQQGQQP